MGNSVKGEISKTLPILKADPRAAKNETTPIITKCFIFLTDKRTQWALNLIHLL